MTSTTKNAPQVWFITGCSSGLGLLLAHAALSRGDKVIATARNPDSLATLAQNDQCRTLALDVTATQSHLDAKISQAVAEFGRIDVLVNNAGYVLSGVWECVENEDLYNQFETNVFGPLRLTRSILPYMRRQGSGRIIFISSVAGWTGVGAGGPYSASKSALEGAVECLKAEISQFNISTHLVVLGMFRTNILNSDRWKLEESDSTSAYASTIGAYGDRLRCADGKQPGDPRLAAERIVDLVSGEGWFEDAKEMPFRVFLGSDCERTVSAKCEAVLKALDANKDLAVSTDFKEDLTEG